MTTSLSATFHNSWPIRHERGWNTCRPIEIQSWADLKEIFVGNFQGTYNCPGNPWDLKNCRQKASETLRGYIRCFSRQCNELRNVADADVIGAFLSGTTCESLVHKLGCKGPGPPRSS